MSLSYCILFSRVPVALPSFMYKYLSYFYIFCHLTVLTNHDTVLLQLCLSLKTVVTQSYRYRYKVFLQYFAVATQSLEIVQPERDYVLTCSSCLKTYSKS